MDGWMDGWTEEGGREGGRDGRRDGLLRRAMPSQVTFASTAFLLFLRRVLEVSLVVSLYLTTTFGDMFDAPDG